MANYHELNIQNLALKMLDGDNNAKNQIINYYSNYIDNLIDTMFKYFECDKDLIREKLLQCLYNCIQNYNNTKANYFSSYLLSHIINTAKAELKKEKNKENSKSREIQKLAERMINGDNDALNKIVEFYTVRIEKLVSNKYSHIDYEEEDLVQVGIIGLLKAIKFYASKQVSHFSTYANNYINRAIESELNLSSKMTHTKYIGLTNNYNIKSFDNFIENAEVKEAIEKLSDVKRKILFLYVYGKCTFEDIGDMFGFSYQRAQDHYKKAIDFIKDELNLSVEKQKKL